jgi:hypothetical protein
MVERLAPQFSTIKEKIIILTAIILLIDILSTTSSFSFTESMQTTTIATNTTLYLQGGRTRSLNKTI